jgi:hypothetical protein
MVKGTNLSLSRPEELLAEVAAATSRLIARHGAIGPFIDVELDLWQALQARLRRFPPAGPGDGPAPH